MSAERLGRRHLQVLGLLAAGREPAEVAEQLGISRSRVWAVSLEARHTLGATTTTQAVALALSLGLIEVEHGQGSRIRRAREHLAAATSLLESA